MTISARLTIWALAICLCVTSAYADPDLSLIRDEALSSEGIPRPDWPVPNDPGQIFFVQRSMNSNTVVYAAQFDGDTGLDDDQPILAYWRRFNTDGAARTLSYAENRFAYGVRVRPAGEGRFQVRLRAVPDIPLILEPTDAPPGARLVLNRAGGALDLSYAYLELREGGLLPSVTELVLVGRDIENGTVRRLTYSVEGGEIEGTQ